MRFVASVYKRTPYHEQLTKIAVAVLESAEMWDQVFPSVEVAAQNRRLGNGKPTV
jgi:hypothetical protein